MHNVSVDNVSFVYVTDRHRQRCTWVKLAVVFHPRSPRSPLFETGRVCVQVRAREAESSLSGQQRSNFKMVLVNNKPMHSWYNWLTAAGISEDQVEVRAMPQYAAHHTMSLLESSVFLCAVRTAEGPSPVPITAHVVLSCCVISDLYSVEFVPMLF